MIASVTTAAPPDWSRLAAEYAPQVRTALADSIVPFWWRAIDAERGGVFSCWNNAGTHLASRDKFTWSQGRFTWMCARLSEGVQRGLLPGKADAFLAHARKTLGFLEAHAMLPEGRCAFRLTEDGQPQEAFSGSGFAPSVYADCFVAMGSAEIARVTSDRTRLDAAWQLITGIERLIASPDCPTWPTPIPEGYAAYAPPMILLNIALTFERAAAAMQDPRVEAARALQRRLAAEIFARYVGADGSFREFYPMSGPASADSLLSRLGNPGHSLEGAWMLLGVAARESRADWLATAAALVRRAFENGWDREHEGLFYYVDREGGEPQGIQGSTAYEKGVRTSWDTKLWWPHTEALVASAASYRLTGDAAARAWFERAFAYTFRVFPNPDSTIGEWIQIRDRRGAPLDRVVALPVKDPYHIMRNLIQLLELFSGTTDLPQA